MVIDDKKHKDKPPIYVGVSTCLLGKKVRYDGGHKHNRYITDILGQYFKFISICPELEAGMGVPRESVRLQGNAEAPRLIGNRTDTDWTDRVNDYTAKRLKKRDLNNLCGFILKKNSPSCGMEKVRVYKKSGTLRREGRGIFARQLIEKFPLIPVEEEGRLNDARIRENFIERVFAYQRLQRLLKGRFNPGKIIHFHTVNKYLLLAHSPGHYKQLVALVEEIHKYSPDEFRRKYATRFMETMTIKTTVRKNINVLQHILSFFKNDLDQDDKKYILDTIEDYRLGLIPLVVPMTLIKHYANKYHTECIIDQIYLNPDPRELMLLNHV